MSLSSYRAAPLRDTCRFHLPAKDSMERVKGVEPSSLGWKPRALAVELHPRLEEALPWSGEALVQPLAPNPSACFREDMLPKPRPPLPRASLSGQTSRSPRGLSSEFIAACPATFGKSRAPGNPGCPVELITALHDHEDLRPPLLRFRMPRWTGFPVPLPPSLFRRGRGISPYYSESGECV